ncbi:hypothetical protein GGQ85_000245 [Nitrobacter vulgaris]|uniref:hypothetical protein n=1 Tax=Nitrobacter vulgaris TaxID=29421 RepID=UPI002861F63F|nr:hypothetical protein [Nitrobacter vulgaris]MDR6302569.1 hypothetical protein [Nitrobacter vulgaris]
MALSFSDHKAMMSGFAKLGFNCVEEPSGATNPIRIDWNVEGKKLRYRLWAFEISHGGGGPTVRAADEFRIQITNGPSSKADIDKDRIQDLLVGYSRDRDAIVAYDRRWLERWIDSTASGSRASPSVQVKDADIQAGHDNGIHHLTKSTNFGEGHIITMSPALLPAYLLHNNSVLQGSMSATEAQSTTPSPAASSIVEYCRSRGFHFEPQLLARYIAALLTKPFVILAGVSGTGKSKLAELVAEFYSASPAKGRVSAKAPVVGTSFIFVAAKGKPDPSRFALVAVRPDWIDNQSILGFVNPITEQYESTQALDLILRASKEHEAATDKKTAPRYFMLLDEMNLARVEHYFSDWLSCTESRRQFGDGKIIQHPVALHRSENQMEGRLFEPDGTFTNVPVPSNLELPTNLVVTGTVNVDETTFGFSPKVLDRAMVIEFDDVDLEELRGGSHGSSNKGFRFPDELPAFRLATAKDYAALPQGTHTHLSAINDILEHARLHFGYRSANEIALFINTYNELLPEEDDADLLRALDIAILQKVLPKISGNRAKLEGPLLKLCAYLRDLKQSNAEIDIQELEASYKVGLPYSYFRALEMLRSLRDFGFVSFFK